MRGPELVRWLLPGVVLGWIGGMWMDPLSAALGSCIVAVISGLMLLRFSAIRQAIAGSVLLGVAIGFGASGCQTRASYPTDGQGLGVCRFELVRSWPNRGNTERWLAIDAQKKRVLLEGSDLGLHSGEVVVAGVRCLVPDSQAHPADFDEGAFLRARGVSAKYEVVWCGQPARAEGLTAGVRRALGAVRKQVAQRCLGLGDQVPAGLLLAFITGDKTELPRPTRAAFSDVGLSHLMAVSGFHVGLVAGMILLVLQAFQCPRLWKPYLFVPLVWAYVGLCGWPGSAVRAGAMSSVAAFAVGSCRKPDGLTVLSAVGVLTAAFRPEALGDLGLGLSFLATAGILLLNRYFAALGWTGWRRYCGMLAGVPLVATACTAPLSWPAFGKLPMCFVPANIMATPLVMAILALFAAWCVVPPVLAGLVKPLLIQLLHLFLNLVEGWSKWGPLLLPLNPNVTTCAGCALALGVLWGLAVKRPIWFGLAGAFTACALLRGAKLVQHHPQRFMVGTDCVVVQGCYSAVFTEHSARPGQSHLKWKTRSLTERVSNHPPDSIRWCGAQWAMTPYYIRCRTAEGPWRVVSSSQ